MKVTPLQEVIRAYENVEFRTDEVIRIANETIGTVNDVVSENVKDEYKRSLIALLDARIHLLECAVYLAEKAREKEKN